jgi:hypothetical protein
MNLESHEKMFSDPLAKEFIDSCLKGDLANVRNMLSSGKMASSLEKNPYLLDEAMLEASHSRKNDIVKYLLSSPELKKHANVHTMKDMIFRTTSVNGNNEILNFIIFDLNIKKTDTIQGCLDREQHSLAFELFRQRDIKNLQQEINEELSINQKSKKKRLKA